MGTDNLFHKRKRALKRKQAKRLAKKRILIVCEGEKTEPDYFKSFCITSAEVKVIGDGLNTKRLVKYAKQEKDKAVREKLPYAQVWCVFDKDDFPKGQFNTAIQMAESYGFYAAYSNEAFELWYLLHFEYLTAGINRSQYRTKLTKHMKKKYRKSDSDMYKKLLNRQKKAIHRAKKLFRTYKDDTPADMNPSTTVHLLVEELNNLSKGSSFNI